MAHRIIGHLSTGSIVQVHEPHETTFARWAVISVWLGEGGVVKSFAIAKGNIERYYKVREQLSQNEHRATLESQATLESSI